MDEPIHIIVLEPALTVGNGFTVTVKVFVGPAQVLAVGVTTKSPEMAVVLLLVAVNEPMLPVPEATMPMAALLFVHA